MKKPGKKQTYTLVELLVVVALAAILFGIGLPAFNTLTKGNAMTSSINEVAGKIKATRAYAVSNACYTALLFPDSADEGWSSSSSADSKLRTAITNRTCRPCVVVPRNNENEWIFDAWIDGEGWLELGKSVIVSREAKCIDSSEKNCGGFAYWSKVPSQSELTNHGDITLRAPVDCTYSVDVPRSYLVEGGNSDKVTFLRAIIFRPNGQLVENVVLSLQEGAVIPGSSGSKPEVVATRDVPVYHALGVNKFNGKIIYYTPITE
ncbi:MAG: hypothetical protein J6A21_10775 [Lentisphaeria bacterium]|nr:hypothetical protein [Lentisphaeria bacterium]